jgi:hypothetical protein
MGFSAVVIVLMAGDSVRAAWLTLRNDTKQELAYCDVKMVNGKAVLGRPVKLLPGECVKENKTAAGSMTIAIIDPAKPKTILAQGTMEWKKDDIVYTIKSDTTGTTIAAAK